MDRATQPGSANRVRPTGFGGHRLCDDARMRITCWPAVGHEHAAKKVIRLRNVAAGRQKELRAAIRTARDGSGQGELFVLERGYSPRGRAVARVAVGLGVVVAISVLVAAFVVPDSAANLLGLGLIPAVMVVVVTAWFSAFHDTGVRVDAGGTLRSEGWGGVREVDLRSFARVTVADDPTFDGDGLWIAE